MIPFDTSYQIPLVSFVLQKVKFSLNKCIEIMLCVTSLKGKHLNKENKMEYYFCQGDEGRQSLLDVVIIKQSPKGENYLN